MKLILREKEFDFSRTYIMGIINVTPDSFSDGGLFKSPNDAVQKALELVKDGADIIDIGGESTRPGALPVSEKEELERVIPVIKKFREIDNMTPLSIDTYKSNIAKQALLNGADIINDISGGTFDDDIMKIASEYNSAYVIMHIKGKPFDMQKDPVYSEKGVVSDIIDFFISQIKKAESIGIKRDKIIIDPGIGFGKTLQNNIEILKNLSMLESFGCPILIGTSRKSFIGNILNKPVNERLIGTVASVILSIINGASIVRVHDVKEIKEAVTFIDFALKNKNIAKVS
jgi:dihydropteroate synthase